MVILLNARHIYLKNIGLLKKYWLLKKVWFKVNLINLEKALDCNYIL